MVFVLDKKKQPLMPCSEKRARLLLNRGKARIHRMYPFTIRLSERIGGDTQPVGIGIDPGSKQTGLAVFRMEDRIRFALVLLELTHRGRKISENLLKRKGFRRQRRAHLWYRKAGLSETRKKGGWLAPSLLHRVENVMSWVDRLKKLVPVQAIFQELVRFDMQSIENPEISGVEYQQGTLQGYEIRECLLEKWGRKCSYCGAENVPLQIEHIHPKAKGGTNRISNLCLSCEPCNTKKGTQPVEKFLKRKPEVLEKIEAQAKRPLKDAAAVNSTRWKLWVELNKTGLPVEAGSGGRTKFNRSVYGVPKDHALDALCAGNADGIYGWDLPMLAIKSMGRGAYQRSRVNASGMVVSILSREKSAKGFRTGDIVKAVVSEGKKAGTYVGRVAIRQSGSFNIQANLTVQGISHKHCRVIQRADGYGYSQRPRFLHLLNEVVSTQRG